MGKKVTKEGTRSGTYEARRDLDGAACAMLSAIAAREPGHSAKFPTKELDLPEMLQFAPNPEPVKRSISVKTGME